MASEQDGDKRVPQRKFQQKEGREASTEEGLSGHVILEAIGRNLAERY